MIEGFYGIPWSWRERRQMMSAQAALGMGLYLYAPKNDPLHRDRWREPYPEAEVARFAALAAHARSLGVTAVFGVSPFIDYAGDEADYATLRDKVRAVLRSPVRATAAFLPAQSEYWVWCGSSAPCRALPIAALQASYCAQRSSVKRTAGGISSLNISPTETPRWIRSITLARRSATVSTRKNGRRASHFSGEV